MFSRVLTEQQGDAQPKVRIHQPPTKMAVSRFSKVIDLGDTQQRRPLRQIDRLGVEGDSGW